MNIRCLIVCFLLVSETYVCVPRERPVVNLRHSKDRCQAKANIVGSVESVGQRLSIEPYQQRLFLGSTVGWVFLII
jgi:hypothetical protein